ncbi:MAG: hypothetical protein ACOC16_01205 [Nanoarchaeota archaeon]
MKIKNNNIIISNTIKWFIGVILIIISVYLKTKIDISVYLKAKHIFKTKTNKN